MINLFFVGDGPRDGDTIPHLVGRILGIDVHPTFRPWARLHRKGYRAKLRFAVLQAQDDNRAGLVATVDRDRDSKGGKLRELVRAREEARQSAPPFPTALGEASPHAEAWLLDDSCAVRQALGLPGDSEIPNVRHEKNPKAALEELKSRSDRAQDPILEILADVARLVDPSRCAHTKETGFHRFAEDVRSELSSLVDRGGE